MITTDNTVKQPVLQLLEKLGIQHDGTLKGIVRATQATWLRKAGSERWHMSPAHAEQKSDILGLLEQLHCIYAVQPTQSHYKYALVHGATLGSIRKRFAFLLEQWNKGTRFDHLIFLGSDRPLDAIIELPYVQNEASQSGLTTRQSWQLTEQPVNEYDALKLVYEQTKLPHEFAQIPTTFVKALAHIKPDGTVQRATTGDTIKAWLASQPSEGTCLFVSHQPYVGYQDSVVRTIMPLNYTLETIGPKANVADTSIPVFLDNVARWLYQELQRRKK